MIANFTPNAQAQNIALRIAQEAGCSSGRVYLADILTKMGILNSIFRILAENIGAIERDAKSLWRLKSNGLDLLRAAENFRCAISEIARSLYHYWAGEKDRDGKILVNGASTSRNTVKKSLQWMESLGLFVLEAEIEKPIFSKVQGKERFQSPDKLFKNFNLGLALQAYEALEQLFHQHLTIPRRLRSPFQMPKHAGMLSRLLYAAAIGNKYRPFGKLPEGLEDLGAIATNSIQFQIAAQQAEAAEISRQINEQLRLGSDRIVQELEHIRQKTIAKIEALKRQSVFLPY